MPRIPKQAINFAVSRINTKLGFPTEKGSFCEFTGLFKNEVGHIFLRKSRTEANCFHISQTTTLNGEYKDITTVPLNTSNVIAVLDCIPDIIEACAGSL